MKLTIEVLNIGSTQLCYLNKDATTTRIMKDAGLWYTRHPKIAQLTKKETALSIYRLIEAEDRLSLHRKYFLTIPTKERKTGNFQKH